MKRFLAAVFTLVTGLTFATLVALNHERAEEERRGIVRWLRPDFQNPTGQKHVAIAVDDDTTTPGIFIDDECPWEVPTIAPELDDPDWWMPDADDVFTVAGLDYEPIDQPILVALAARGGAS